MTAVSPHTLCSETLRAVTHEKKATLEVLRYLRRVDTQKAYLELGFSSLFNLCVSYLKYSESAAQRRIQAVRLLRDLGADGSRSVQAVEEKLRTGSLNLSRLAMAQRVFQHQKGKNVSVRQIEKLQVLKRFENLPHRECERVAARLTGTELPIRDFWQVSKDSEVRLSVTLDVETRELLDKFKQVTAHLNPMASTSEAIKLALQIAIGQKDPALNPPKRRSTAGKKIQNIKDNNVFVRGYIGKEMKHELFAGDSDGCAWVDSVTKKRCGSKFKLEIDHITPVSRGGGTQRENLQLLCSNHNRYKGNRM